MGVPLRRCALAVLVLAALAASQTVLVAPAAAVPGLQRLSILSIANSSNKFATVNCPAGKVVVGGGGYVVGVASGRVHVDQLEPLLSGTGFRVGAHEAAGGYAGNWSLAAIALCAPAPAGYQVVSSSSPPGDGSASAVAVCPFARKALGAGGKIAGGTGEVLLDDIFVPLDLGSITVLGYEDEDGYANTWLVTAYAICAYPQPQQQLVSVMTGFDSAPTQSVTVSCPAGTAVHGGGFTLFSGLGEVALSRLDIVGTASVTVRTYEDATGQAGDWSLVGYAICAA